MKRPIYLDHHATTPVDPRVLEAMLPWFSESFGNPASRNHAWGWEARDAVDKARRQTAALIGANPREIVFTSGATESNNLAIKGLGWHARHNRMVTCQTEHKAVLDPAEWLEEELGFEVERLHVDPDGTIALDELEEALQQPSEIVSLMAANNEIGTLHPLDEISRICRRHGAHLHVDAAQAAGRIPLDVKALDIDLLSISGHKLYGPKGVGALYVRAGLREKMEAQMHGGGHERGLRSGTLNVPGVVGLGAACEIAAAESDAEAERLSALRDRLLERLTAELDGVHVNGLLAPRLPNNLNVSFEGVDGETLLGKLDGVAVSSGSACTTADPQPSHVLRALGLSDKLAQASLRFGLGRSTTAEEIEQAADQVIAAVRRLRALSAVGSART
ncbi:MAG: aminotransferase class V-fold PLP-dependent enzyme [Acidobacteria bacterium]|nr:aminotransferase class V-fold PLP-dependent enzyme [Acidobacteriota bacterium]